MMKTNLLRLAAALSLGLGIAGPVQAADFPSQQMKIVVPLPPGSAPDFLSRIISASFQQQWGQTVVIDNKPGAAQNVGAELVARAVPWAALSIGTKGGADTRSYQVSFAKLRAHLPDLALRWTVDAGIDELLRAMRDGGMTKARFEGREFVRLRQLRHGE